MLWSNRLEYPFPFTSLYRLKMQCNAMIFMLYVESYLSTILPNTALVLHCSIHFQCSHNPSTIRVFQEIRLMIHSFVYSWLIHYVFQIPTRPLATGNDLACHPSPNKIQDSSMILVQSFFFFYKRFPMQSDPTFNLKQWNLKIGIITYPQGGGHQVESNPDCPTWEESKIAPGSSSK